MNLKEWLLEREFAFHRIETLVVLLLSASYSLMEVVLPFISTYTSSGFVHLGISSIVFLAIIVTWYYNRSIFPSSKKGKEHIVIAIVTENAKQKTRITTDFANQIKKQLAEFSLDTNYEVTILHNYQSTILQNRINLYGQSLRANLENSVEVLKFEKLTKRMKAKFIIYGNLIKRNSENSTYCLSLEGMIRHKPIDLERGLALHGEFRELWNNEMTFLEREELTGFKVNAEHIFFTASYMLGLATFVDNNFLQGIKIWEGLESYLQKKPELKEHIEKVKRLKSAEYLLHSRWLYFKGEIEESMAFRSKYLDLAPNEYDKYLIEAVNHIKVRNDPQLALEFVEKAKLIAPKNDGTWRYSKFYLLIKLHRCTEALKLFEEILSHTYPNELDTINQVIAYNTACINEDHLHIQSNFIIGALIYKKLDHPIPAYEKLELFIDQASGNKAFEPLIEKAKEYIAKINGVIGIDT